MNLQQLMSSGSWPKRCFFGVFAFFMLLASHYIQPNVGGMDLDLPGNVVTWIFVSAVACVGLYQIASSGIVLITPLCGFIFVGASFLFVPLLYANYQGFPVGRLWAVVAGCFMYFALVQFRLTRQEYHYLLFLLVVCLLIKVSLYLCQMFVPYEASLDWSRPWENALFDKIIANFQTPNVAGICFVTGIVASKILMHLRFHSDQKNKLINSITWLYIGLASFAVALLQSRISYITLAFVSIAMFALAWQKNRKTGITFILVMIISFCLGSMATPHSQERQRHLTADKMFSDSVRTSLYLYSWEMIKQKPLTGWGYGRMEASFLESYTTHKIADRPVSHIGARTYHPHNELLYWFVEGGVIPVFGLLVMVGGYLRGLWCSRQRDKYWYLILIAPLMMHMMVEHPFYNAAFSFFIFILILYSIDIETKAVVFTFKAPFFCNAAATVFLVASTGFMLTSLQANYIYSMYMVRGADKPQVFQQVFNYGAQHARIMEQLYRWRKINAIKNKNRRELEAWVQWAYEYVQHLPRQDLLAQLSHALHMLGRDREAKEIFQKAHAFYPEIRAFGSYDFIEHSPRL